MTIKTTTVHLQETAGKILEEKDVSPAAMEVFKAIGQSLKKNDVMFTVTYPDDEDGSKEQDIWHARFVITSIGKSYWIALDDLMDSFKLISDKTECGVEYKQGKLVLFCMIM